MIELSKTTLIRNNIPVFFFIIFFFSSSSLNVQGYFYQTDLQVGETLVYKRHDYNSTTQSWSPWTYSMFEIISIQDTQVEFAETIIKAVQWVSNDTINWKQMPFLTSTIGQIQENDLTETGTISRLQEIPIHRFSRFQDENFVIRSDIKIGELISNIETNINNMANLIKTEFYKSKTESMYWLFGSGGGIGLFFLGYSAYNAGCFDRNKEKNSTAEIKATIFR